MTAQHFDELLIANLNTPEGPAGLGALLDVRDLRPAIEHVA